MFKQIAVYAALASFAMAGSGLAQSAGPGAFQPEAGRPTQAKLTEIVTWLASNFDLPAIYDHPSVELAPARKIVAMRYKGVLSDRWREDSIDDPAVLAAHQRNVVAVYHDKTKTIVLPESWTGANPVELSILVHEMVHHLQNLGKLEYECPAAREKPAYLAQDQFLQLHRLDLEKEFEIDKFTLVARSACMS